LADFDRCPRQYYFRNVLHLPEPPSGSGDGNGNAPDMGIVAHAIIERIDWGGSRPNEDEIRRMAELVGVSAGVSPQECSTIATDLIRYAAGADESAAAREVSFFCHVGESMFIRGRIDALIQRDGLVVIRDYKYAHACDPTAYQVQMEAYALAAAELDGEGRTAAELIFLRDSCVTPVSLPPLPLIRSRMVALGREIVEAQRTGEYRKRPAHREICRHLGCGFISRCWQTT
jgi:PD-(D/E)XK nuclease superfamily